MRVCLGPVVVLDPGHPQPLIEPPLSVTAAAQRPRLAQGIGCVVDITELGETICKCLQIGRPLAVPAPLAKLAREIDAELSARGRIFADIAESELLERLLVKRRQCTSRLERCLHALFVPQ